MAERKKVDYTIDNLPSAKLNIYFVFITYLHIPLNEIFQQLQASSMALFWMELSRK
jgi:hypothetical protein